VVATLESTQRVPPTGPGEKIAERSGLSKSTIGRIWKGFGLEPHLTDGFELSNDPMFVDKVYDVVPGTSMGSRRVTDGGPAAAARSPHTGLGMRTADRTPHMRLGRRAGPVS